MATEKIWSMRASALNWDREIMCLPHELLWIKELKDVRAVVAQQAEQIQQLAAMVNSLVGVQAVKPDTTVMFPDVSEESLGI